MTGNLILDGVSWVLICLGSFFVVTGAVGILRMPDFYSRMHAASVIDTAGAVLLVLGLCLQAGSLLVAFKLVVVMGLLFFIGPVASHALAQAALAAGIEPKLDDDRRDQEVPGGGRQREVNEETLGVRDVGSSEA